MTTTGVPSSAHPPSFSCANEDHAVAKDIDAFGHLMVRASKILEGENLPHTWIDSPFVEQPVVGPRLVVVGPVRPLESLLKHPQVT